VDFEAGDLVKQASKLSGIGITLRHVDVSVFGAIENG
jgi:hypothetical protein